MLHIAIAEGFPWNTFSDQSLQVTVQRSANVFVEVALKVYSLGGEGSEQAELDRVLTGAFGLLSLQYELARNTVDIVHGLSLIVPDSRVATDLICEAPTVRYETVDAAQKEADQARALAGDIGQQLETLMFRVFQLEKLPDTVHGVADLARKIEATLVQAQGKVDSLRPAAPPLADSHTPPELRPVLESLQSGFSRNQSVDRQR